MMRGFRWLVHDIWWKLAALVFAAVVWSVVSAEPEIETVMTVPVQYANRPADLEVGADYLQSIRLELRGTSGRLRDLNNTKTAVVVDFSDVRTPGERSFPITQENARLPRTVQLVRSVPSELHFRFERSARKMVRVEVRVSGKLPGGGSPQISTEPLEVQVAGPAPQVNQIRFVLTDPVDLNSIQKDAVRMSAIYADEPEVRILTRPQVKVNIHINHSGTN